MSDSEEFDEMMDIEFPMDDSSIAIDDQQEDEPEERTQQKRTSSSPLIDVTIDGWDDGIVSKCFLVAVNCDSMKRDDFESIIQPDKRLNVNSRKVERLNGSDDDQISTNEQQSSISDDRDTSEMQEKGCNHAGTFDRNLTTPNWAI